MQDWDLFLWPYREAVSELKIKLRALRESYLIKGEHSPIEFVVGRVKTVDSIKEKMERRVIPPDLNLVPLYGRIILFETERKF